MPFVSVSGGLTLSVPLPGTRNYHATFLTNTFQKIADHDHTGGGNGTQIGPSALAANAVTGSSLRLNNNQALRARNAANSADVDMIKLDASDKIVLGANLTTLALDTPLVVGSGGLGISTTPSNGFLPIGNGTNYTAAAITGTANRITVTNGAGTIGLNGPQDIHTAASPTFVSTTLSGLTASQAVFTDGSKLLTTTAALSTWSPTATANGAMTATADAVYSAKYIRIGNFIHFFCGMSFTVGGTPDTTINISVPWSGTAHNVNLTFACAANDGGGGGISDARWRYDGTNIIVFKAGLANWTAGVNAAIFISDKVEA